MPACWMTSEAKLRCKGKIRAVGAMLLLRITTGKLTHYGYMDNSPCEERFFRRHRAVRSVHRTSITAELHHNVHSMQLGVMQKHDQFLLLYWLEHQCSVATHRSQHVHCGQHNATYTRAKCLTNTNHQTESG